MEGMRNILRAGAGVVVSGVQSLVEAMETAEDVAFREQERVEEEEAVLRRLKEETETLKKYCFDLEERYKREIEALERELSDSREEWKRKRDEETKFWTTPGQRPLAEPPILDWDWFFRTRIPSDLRYKALFRNNPGKRADFKDLEGEGNVLGEYREWARIMKDDAATEDQRRDFYSNLAQDLEEDFDEVSREHDNIWLSATDLGRFEFKYLDNDGRTTKLEEWVEKGADICYGQPDEVKEKYQKLVPEDFVENRLATSQFHWLDCGGRTGPIERQLSEASDIFLERSDPAIFGSMDTFVAGGLTAYQSLYAAAMKAEQEDVAAKAATKEDGAKVTKQSQAAAKDVKQMTIRSQAMQKDERDSGDTCAGSVVKLRHPSTFQPFSRRSRKHRHDIASATQICHPPKAGGGLDDNHTCCQIDGEPRAQNSYAPYKLRTTVE